MARTNATNFSGGLQFPYATAATDVFHKEDIQTLAQAVDQHDHTTGKGLSVAPANASVTNAKLASDTARANLLTNGSMEVWSRGNGPFSTSAAFAADRWQVQNAPGAGTVSASRDGANQDAGSQYCAAVTYTPGAGDTLPSFWQALSGVADGLTSQLIGRQLAFSVRVKTSISGVRPWMMLGGVRTYGTAHPGGGTYQTLTIVGAPTSSELAGSLYCGVAFTAGTGGVAYVDNAMLVVGSQPADYAPMHPADELARCVRYYEILFPEIPTQSVAASQAFGYGVSYRAVKPVVPTLTRFGSWAVSNCAQPTVGSRSGTETFGFYILSTSTAAGVAFFNPTAATPVVAEANP